MRWTLRAWLGRSAVAVAPFMVADASRLAGTGLGLLRRVDLPCPGPTLTLPHVGEGPHPVGRMVLRGSACRPILDVPSRLRYQWGGYYGGSLGSLFRFPLPMNRVAVFVDAGYVFAQGSVLLAGRKLPRGETSLDHVAAIASLATFAGRVAGVALLRVYWYDGTSTGPRAQHLTLAHLDNVKVRLGFVNSVGEQKGVDSLIVTDMITLARNRAICDAVLVSGDEEADTTHEWTDAEVASFLSCKPKPISTSGSVPRGATATANGVVSTPLDTVAAKVAAALEKSVLLTLIEAFEGSGQLPRDVDRQIAGRRSVRDRA